jgi:hypothetical protein
MLIHHAKKVEQHRAAGEGGGRGMASKVSLVMDEEEGEEGEGLGEEEVEGVSMEGWERWRERRLVEGEISTRSD